MKKRGSLGRLFKKCAGMAVLSVSLLNGTAAAQEAPAPAPPAPVVETVGCPAFPDFKFPAGPMHRVPRDRTPDLDLRAQQLLLKQIGIVPGSTDGLGGNLTRAAIREYLMFYAPLYKGDENKFELNDTDSLQLKKYAEEAERDAKTYAIPSQRAAALRLASHHTGVAFATLSRSSHEFDNASWLYMVKTYGASYGLEFYARHIALTESNGKTSARVDNPFVHRQILDLKDHPRVSVLMEAEYLKHQASMPAIEKKATPPLNEAVRAQQKDLSALGFDVGTPDGVKGTLTEISMAEFQLLYGDGNATGTLSAGEISALKKHADKARSESTAYNISSLATGAIRMASDRSGADYGYMMELAAAESSFMHHARANTSSATGLYQFIEGTWSHMVLNYGGKHGLGDFAGEVEIYKDDVGRTQARFSNPLVRAEMMDLRQHPQLSALFAADFQAENKAREGCYIPGELTRTDLYLAHFLGASDAVWFLSEMRKNPDQSAVSTFPEAAQYNVGVFYETKRGVPQRERSLKEVYAIFERKFDGSTYDPKPVAAAPKPQKPAT